MTIGSHQRTVGRSQVHITPRWILDALGTFDLDPCAADPRPWDCARNNFTEADNGLRRDRPECWRVWCNPPFDTRGIAPWIARMAAHGYGTLLVHARTDTEWFQPIWDRAAGLLFLSGRVVFHKPDGSRQTVSNPESKHYGKVANSGAPVVLAAFGAADARILSGCGLPGKYVPLGASIASSRDLAMGLHA